MTVVQIILLALLALVVVPVMTYLVTKFAAAGYFRAKERYLQRQSHNHRSET